MEHYMQPNSDACYMLHAKQRLYSHNLHDNVPLASPIELNGKDALLVRQGHFAFFDRHSLADAGQKRPAMGMPIAAPIRF